VRGNDGKYKKLNSFHLFSLCSKTGDGVVICWRGLGEKKEIKWEKMRIVENE